MANIETLTPILVEYGIFTCKCGKILEKAPYYHIMANENSKRVLCSYGSKCLCGAQNPMFFRTKKLADEMIDIILSVPGEKDATVANIS